MNTLKTLILLASLSALIIWMGGTIGGSTGATIAVVIALAMNFASYWWSDKIVLSMYKAQEVTPDQAPELYNATLELAQNAGLPMPKLYIIPEDTPNAFATGRNHNHSAVAVTSGIMRILNMDELKGVIAHELAHIKHRDILISSIAATISTAITYLSYMAMFFGGGREDNRGNPIALIAMMILAPLAATIIRMALSRTREFLADKGGAEICGNPLHLAGALRKLGEYSGRSQLQVSEQVADSTAHMFIVNPLLGKGLAALFSTHPPMEQRIEKLEDMAAGIVR
ncbi:MAG: zinc metalloprotease HtpX [Candidatus Dadabacteria bacterium]|nr:zinc metalloprotease HtpX [Candidatus Dadabacteria bacterium]